MMDQTALLLLIVACVAQRVLLVILIIKAQIVFTGFNHSLQHYAQILLPIAIGIRMTSKRHYCL